MDDFFSAVQVGDCHSAVDCLYDGARVNGADGRGCQPLFYAVENGDGPMVKLLLNYGADINAFVSDTNETALGVVAAHEDTRVARLLLEMGANPEIGDSEGWSALHTACACGNLKLAKLLVEYGGNIHAVSPSGQNVLHLAATVSSSSVALPLVKWLVMEQGVDVFLKDKSGRTALHHACRTGIVLNDDEPVEGGTVVKMLLEHFPELCHERDANGRIPLHYAVKDNFVAMVTLIEKGSNMMATDIDNRSPLHYACMASEYSANFLLSRIRQESHVDIHGADAFGNTVLHYASRSGFHNIIQTLLDNCEKDRSMNHCGRQPLHVSGRFDNVHQER